MAHKCFISYKKEDIYYKNELLKSFEVDDVIDTSLNWVIDSEDGDYIMQTIRDKCLRQSTVTICLIGSHSSENEGKDRQGRLKNYFIIRELQASLYEGENNTRNGILGIVLPEMYEKIYGGSYICKQCGRTHTYVNVSDDTVVKEFSQNYYIEPHQGCAWTQDERYCVLVKWDDFLKSPEQYVEMAFSKRNTSIAKSVVVRARR